MDCRRCTGLMVPTRMKETMSGDSVSGWRCLLCGEATDFGIEANRKGHQEPEAEGARPPGSPALGAARRRARR
jgi:hypothetical protein